MLAVPYEAEEIDALVRLVIGKHARLAVDVAVLGDADDLFRLGLTSHANVSLMLALEDGFGIEFPPSMLQKETFRSLASIRTAVTELLGPS